MKQERLRAIGQQLEELLEQYKQAPTLETLQECNRLRIEYAKLDVEVNRYGVQARENK